MIGRVFDFQKAAEWAEVQPCTLRQWLLRGEILSMRFGPKNYLSCEEMSLMLWAKNPLQAARFDQEFGIIYEWTGVKDNAKN